MLLTSIITAVFVIISSLSQHGISDIVLAGTVTLHNRLNQVLWHISIVSQELLGILRQAIAAVTEARVVVVSTDTRIKTYAINDSLCVKSLHFCICIKLIEVAYSECQIGIGEELDSLCFLHAHKQGVDVLLDGTLLQ